jgi:hypothetical protein
MLDQYDEAQFTAIVVGFMFTPHDYYINSVDAEGSYDRSTGN